MLMTMPVRAMVVVMSVLPIKLIHAGSMTQTARFHTVRANARFVLDLA